jgi:hypothetical protein
MPLPKGKEFYIGAVFYALVFGGSGAGIDDKDNDDKCKGTLRWDVKVASDEAAEEIKQKSKVITLAELVQYRTDTLPKGNARSYSEKFTYTLKDVFITHAILEDDNDLHLVIEDGQQNTLIAEIPDVNCKITEDSRFATQIKKARNTFMRYQNTYDQYQFDITGVFFKDKSHGQTGRAPNNVELHPVTALKKIRKINAN